MAAQQAARRLAVDSHGTPASAHHNEGATHPALSAEGAPLSVVAVLNMDGWLLTSRLLQQKRGATTMDPKAP